MAADELQHFEAMHIRHVEIENHQADRAERELLDRLEAAARFGKANSADPGKGGPDHAADSGRVVNDDNALHAVFEPDIVSAVRVGSNIHTTIASAHLSKGYVFGRLNSA